MKLPEAKKSVIKNYDRSIKRTVETTQNDIFAGYLDSFARALDPHSSYMSRDLWEDFRISMELKLQGIGATLSSQDGFTVVEALVPGGAAARSGLIEPQDKIIAVGQGDNPAIIQALSPMGEKLSFMARGALRSKKRFGGGK